MFQLILSGLALGCIYSLVALGYHITFMTSRTLNFAQGSAMMLGAVAALILVVAFGWPTPLAMAAAILLLGIFGLLLERLAVRPFVLRGSVAWVMSTLAVGIILENVVLLVFGKSPRGLPNALALDPVTVLGAGIYPLELLIPVVVLLVVVGARLFYGGTMLGRALRGEIRGLGHVLGVAALNANRLPVAVPQRDDPFPIERLLDALRGDAEAQDAQERPRDRLAPRPDHGVTGAAGHGAQRRSRQHGLQGASSRHLTRCRA